MKSILPKRWVFISYLATAAILFSGFASQAQLKSSTSTKGKILEPNNKITQLLSVKSQEPTGSVGRKKAVPVSALHSSAIDKKDILGANKTGSRPVRKIGTTVVSSHNYRSRNDLAPNQLAQAKDRRVFDKHKEISKSLPADANTHYEKRDYYRDHHGSSPMPQNDNHKETK